MPARAIGNIILVVERENFFFRHAFKQVTKTEDDDRVRDDQDTLAAVFARHRVHDTAEAKDHVAPSLAARRTMVKLAERGAYFRLFGIFLLDAGSSNWQHHSRGRA